MTKREVNQMMMKVVNQVVNSIRPLILKQDKKITELSKEIFNADKKLEGIKRQVIYKTKDGFICPVCGKDMEDEIYEEALQYRDTILKKLKESKVLLKKNKK